jgi:Predicted phosphotransferase related to Ser/Thr protein kinases
MDDRLNALDAWLRATLAGVDFRIEPASADASFRRYFRVFAADGRTLIAMDAPPERENSEPFVRIAGMFRDAGLNAPEVLAQDLPKGFLLLTDLGTRSYLQALRAENFDALFGDATPRS